jgi:hypothetical protein
MVIVSTSGAASTNFVIHNQRAGIVLRLNAACWTIAARIEFNISGYYA